MAATTMAQAVWNAMWPKREIYVYSQADLDKAVELKDATISKLLAENLTLNRTLTAQCDEVERLKDELAIVRRGYSEIYP